MRPERSVIASPSETKMKGVETRMAPPRMASGTPHRPMSVALHQALLFHRSGLKALKRP